MATEIFVSFPLLILANVILFQVEIMIFLVTLKLNNLLCMWVQVKFTCVYVRHQVIHVIRKYNCIYIT